MQYAPGGWRLVSDEREEPLPDWIAAWDMSQTLRVRREIEIDLDRVLSQTRLGEDTRLAVSVVYASEFEEEACPTRPRPDKRRRSARSRR